VGWAIDEHNRSVVSADVEAQVEAARKDIIAGKVVVTDYMSQ
ncbi:MAG: BMP family ABC transporter substrate-binding protein, partial [Alphaproteobacteria bacterium]|nr:BMP family ABC transporter substrate-binding protein [Alphaproteobacteria bacterium]